MAIDVENEELTIRTSYFRFRRDSARVSQVFESKRFTNNPAICLACGEKLNGRDSVFLILGPGNDSEMQERHKMGRWYDAKAVELHATCAGAK